MEADKPKDSPVNKSTDWERLKAMTDADIERAIAEDPDLAPIASKDEWKQAIVRMPRVKHTKESRD